MSKIEISNSVQSAYDEQYVEEMTPWRELGAKFKARNILSLIGNDQFSKVLEYGAGEGSILKFLNETEAIESLFAVEISDSGIEQIKKRKLSKLKNVQKFDGYSTPFKDNEFDLVYCSHVIEHVEHPRLVLREIKRISKNQIFEVPLDYSMNVDKKIDHYLGYGHINVFTPSLFRFLLKSEGFEILDDLHNGMIKEVLEYSWYENLRLKKSLFRRLFAIVLANKGRITKMFLGKKVANEFYQTAYACRTTKTGDITIF